MSEEKGIGIIIMWWLISILYLIFCLIVDLSRFCFWLSGIMFGLVFSITLIYFKDKRTDKRISEIREFYRKLLRIKNKSKKKKKNVKSKTKKI